MRTALTTLIAFAFTLVTQAATYYIDPQNGNDTNAGSIGSPWQTLAKAESSGVAAGNTIYLRGGLYTGPSNIFHATVHGTAQSPITLAAYPGETPVLTNMISIPWADYPMTVSGSNWIISGIWFRGNDRNLRLVSAHHCVITNCLFGESAATNDYAGVWVYGSSQLNKFVGCTFTNWGGMTPEGPTCNDNGTPFFLGNGNGNDDTKYNLIEQCRFTHGGHDLMEVESGWNVIRSNYFDNSMFRATNVSCYTFPFNGLPNNYGAWGNRVVKPGDPYDTQVDSRNVWDSNIMAGTGPADDDGWHAIEVGTSFNIYRRNVIVFSKGLGFYLNSVGNGNANSNAIYANTIAMNGKDAVELNTTGIIKGGVDASNFQTATRRTGNWLINNIIWANAGGPAVGAWFANYNMVGVNYTNGNPLFANTNGYGTGYLTNGNLPNLALTATSPCIDAGQWLTTVASANGSGTSVVVSNAYVFSDGNKIASGDLIQLQGQTVTATVTNIDLTTGTLYLAQSLSWTNGQGVSLAYSGSAPDIGAFEFLLGPIPNPPVIRARLGGLVILSGRERL